MSPFSFPTNLFSDMMQEFSIERNGEVIETAKGFFCGHNYPNTIQFNENLNIRNGDWIIDTKTNQRYHVIDAQPKKMNGVISYWMVKYETEIAYRRAESINRQANINIGTVSGNSVIGNQENVIMNIGHNIDDIKKIIDALPADEQVTGQELLDTLKSTEEATHPVLVEGSLSKFSDLIKKHSDLLIAVGNWAVKLLIGQQR